MEKSFRKTKTNKIARNSREYDFTVYRTPEEDAKMIAMFSRTKKPPVFINKKLTELYVKHNFHIQLRKIFEDIEPEYNAGWIRYQTGISHSCIIRTLNGDIVPSTHNLFQFLYLIYHYRPNFNIWFLVDPHAPMFNEQDYTPFVN